MQQRIARMLMGWCLALCASALGLAPAHASATFLVCTHELPPHSMRLADGQAGGMASEVLQAVAKRLRWTLKIEYFPWLRARQNTESGECDLIYTILKKPEYEVFAQFPKQHLADRHNVLVVRKSSGLKYAGDLEAFMRRHSIGTYADKAVSPLFDKLKAEPWARVHSNLASDNNLEMLLEGRFDAAIENSATAVYELNKLHRAHEAEILLPPLLVTPAYIAFSKNGKALPFIGDFDREMQAYTHSAEYRALLKRYETMGKPMPR